MLKTRCRACGAPKVVGTFGRWNTDGTITSRFSKKAVRACFVECEEARSLIDGISARIGFPIDRIVAEGERKANRRVVGAFLSTGGGLFNPLARSRIGVPFAIAATQAIATGLGHGMTELLEHRRGQRIRVRVHRPYSVPLIAGDLWGTYEAYFTMTASATWELEGDAVVITIEKAQDSMVWVDPLRLNLENKATSPGEVELDRCSRCGVPLEMTRTVSWDTGSGIMVNRLTGRREITIIVEALNAVIRELTEELGEEVPRMVSEIERDYVAGVMGGIPMPNTTREYKMLLGEMCVLGHGNPVEVSKEAGVLSVRIDSPFCEPVLAGRVAGYFQVLEGVRAEATWTPGDEGYTIIKALPA